MVTSKDKLSMLASLALATLLTAGAANAQEEGMEAPAAAPSTTMQPPAHDEPTAEGESPAEALMPPPARGNRCFCCDFPNWYVDVGALWLKRTSAQDLNLATINTLGATSTLNISDLDFDYEPGVYVTAGKALNCMSYVEAVYFGLQDYNSTGVNVSTPTTIITAGVASWPFLALLDQTVNYQSELNNLEFNYKANVYVYPHVSLFLGIRSLFFNETMTISETGITDPGTGALNPSAPFVTGYAMQTHTSNLLIGPQIGASTTYSIGNRLQFGVFGKAAWCGNIATGSIAQTTIDGAFSNIARYDEDNRTDQAFILEAQVSGQYFLTQNVAVRGGFHLMTLRGAVLAPEQIPLNIFGSTSSMRLDFDGRPVYYGPFAQVEVRWGGCE